MNKILNKNQYDAYGYFHGYWEGYWSNGNLCYKGNYSSGRQIGYWEWFNANGKKNIEKYYL